MSDTKHMDSVFANNRIKARDIIKQKKGLGMKDIEIMLDLQFDLMVYIINKKELWNYGLDKLMSNMVLSIMDELIEYDVWKNTINETIRKIAFEEMFEIVDAIHFVLQLALLSVVKEKGYDLSEIANYKEEIVNDAKEILNVEYAKLNGELTIRRYIYQLSYILEKLHWKHWKNYTEFDAQELNNRIRFLYLMLLNSFNNASITYATTMKDYYQPLVLEIYVIKNIENFDRQDRGY
jgi:hypothetical protein